jgi:TM2 domain-containing membrane protein YozV
MELSATASPTNNEATLVVDLKDPRLAAFLAWLVPGLGHLYQGRTGKGILFAVCIIGTFLFGLYIGEGKVVYAADVLPSRQFFSRWQYVCQVGAGLPALPAYVQAWRNEQGKLPIGGYEHYYQRPPRMQGQGGDFTTIDSAGRQVNHPNELAKWYYDLGDLFELGTVFTVIAGLLNILAIYDAHGGPLVIVPSDQEKKPPEGEAKR